jgi:SAM-dependent methyltransferase
MRALSIQKHLEVFHEINRETDGFALSKQARLQTDALEYTYGEISFIPFVALLSLARPNKNTIFYDLGSGAGKAVFACSMIYNVKKSCGIEIFDNLYEASEKQQKNLLEIPEYTNIAKNICFINADFLNYDFSDATLIFINSTGLFGETWDALNEKLDELTDVTIITTSKKLLSDKFTLEKTTLVEMSWGIVETYIHTRL